MIDQLLRRTLDLREDVGGGSQQVGDDMGDEDVASGGGGVDLLDAFLWIKRPAESDGACRGAPQAGQLHLDYALELARNAEP